MSDPVEPDPTFAASIASAVVDAWEAADGEDATTLESVALHRARPPTFRARVVSRTGDTLGLQVIGSELPSGSTRAVYVEHHGPFEMLRVERWPPSPGQRAPRVLLKLRVWPTRRKTRPGGADGVT